MIWLILAVAVASPPAKLIIMSDKPAMAIDYPTMERCERARAALDRQIEQDMMNKEAAAELEKRLGRPVLVQRPRAYCIPG